MASYNQCTGLPSLAAHLHRIDFRDVHLCAVFLSLKTVITYFLSLKRCYVRTEITLLLFNECSSPSLLLIVSLAECLCSRQCDQLCWIPAAHPRFIPGSPGFKNQLLMPLLCQIVTCPYGVIISSYQHLQRCLLCYSPAVIDFSFIVYPPTTPPFFSLAAGHCTITGLLKKRAVLCCWQ